MSSKLSRQPPTQNFENYTIYKVIDKCVGLTQYSDLEFSIINGTIENLYTGPSEYWTNYSVPLEIGFDFKFNNKIYKNLHVSQLGWITLDAQNETWDLNNFFILSAGTIPGNNRIYLNTSTDSVLLCPWHSVGLQQYSYLFKFATNDYRQFTPGTGNWLLKYDSINYGCDIKNNVLRNSDTNFNHPYPYDGHYPAKWGIKYKRINNTKYGRCLIIRWNMRTILTGLAFEIVLYENSRIEFRYDSLDKLKDFYFKYSSLVHDPILQNYYATIGIFGNNIFRDFGNELIKTTQIKYARGGAIRDPYYIDTSFSNTANYTISLSPNNGWPKNGGMFIIEPQKNIRKVLPNLLIKENTTLFNDSIYADISVPNITQSSIHFPSKLNRYIQNNSYVQSTYQDVLEGGLFTSGTSISQFDSITILNQKIGSNVTNKQFNDTDIQIINDDISTFYISGSDINTNINESMLSKEKITMVLPLEFSTELLPTASAMYYYDKSMRYMKMCHNDNLSYYTITDQYNVIHTVPTISTKNRGLDRLKKFSLPEDSIGFDAFGHLITSGTYNGTLLTGSFEWDLTQQANSNEYINKPFTQQRFKNAINDTYGNSVCINSLFDATDDQLIDPQLQYPFVIEGAEIELPIEIGVNWFNDITRAIQPYNSLDECPINVPPYLDIGGPAVTCALFHQYKTSTGYIRNLILSSTFTSINDHTSSIGFYTSSYGANKINRFSLNGFETIGGIASTYLEQNFNNKFSGSVIMQTKPMTTIGTTCVLYRHFDNNQINITNALNNPLENINSIGTSPFINKTIFKINNVHNYSRNQLGFTSQNQSAFGGTFLTNTKILQNYKQYFSNVKTQYASYLSSSIASSMMIPIPLMKFNNTPYVLYPGQKLIFAISKCRPAYKNVDGDGECIATHFDMRIPINKKIKITLFGSYLSEEKPKHFNTKIQTQTITDIIGDESVLDQLEFFNYKSFYGNIYDRFMTGSILENNRIKAFNISQANTSSGSIGGTYTKNV